MKFPTSRRITKPLHRNMAGQTRQLQPSGKPSTKTTTRQLKAALLCLRARRRKEVILSLQLVLMGRQRAWRWMRRVRMERSDESTRARLLKNGPSANDGRRRRRRRRKLLARRKMRPKTMTRLMAVLSCPYEALSENHSWTLSREKTRTRRVQLNDMLQPEAQDLNFVYFCTAVDDH